MNHTRSGIMAIGAPGSVARLKSELENAKDEPSLLLLTDEGRSLLKRFAASQGCSWEDMPEEIKASHLTKERASELFGFIAGVNWALEQR